MKRIALTAGLALALSFSALTPARALEEDQPRAGASRVVPVRYADLDPAAPVDAARLLSRLRNAAMRACHVSEVAQPGPSLRRAIQACEDHAIEQAVARVNAPELTRLHQAQYAK